MSGGSRRRYAFSPRFPFRGKPKLRLTIKALMPARAIGPLQSFNRAARTILAPKFAHLCSRRKTRVRANWN